MSAPEPIDAAMLRSCAPPPVNGDGDKEARGALLVLAGGSQVAGAAVLSGLAGLRVGAGKLQYAAPAKLCTPLAFAVPEARVIAAPEHDGEIDARAAEVVSPQLERADAVVVGPGMLDGDLAGALAAQLMRGTASARFVVDAAALTGLRSHLDVARLAAGRIVATPHAGEMAALSGGRKADVEADPLGAARDAAARLQAVVVMKGAETFVVSPDGRAWSHSASLPGLGVSGSGDVLAGVIGGLLARGASPLGAAAWGVRLHAAAGAALATRIGPLGFLARELLDELPRQLAELSAATRLARV